MPKIRRVRAQAQLPFAADHVVVVKTKHGTYEVSGKADVNGMIERFAPVQFADLSGALSIANYWAAVQNLSAVHVFTSDHRAFTNERLMVRVRSHLRSLVRPRKRPDPKIEPDVS